jgi:hypothetical protein
MASPRIPKDSDFIHQYGGSVNQYGTAGSGPISDQNAEDFQKHMQIQGTQNQQVPKISPHTLMSGQVNSHFNTPQINPMNSPAPENFGPPRVGETATDNSAQFGPPNSQGFKNVSQNFGSPKPGTSQNPMSGTSTDQNQVASRQQQMQARFQNAQSSTQQAGMSLNAANNQGANLQSGAQGGGSGGGDSKNKDVTYKSVEKQEVDSMLENAMSHMKFKDPDPSSWS